MQTVVWKEAEEGLTAVALQKSSSSVRAAAMMPAEAVSMTPTAPADFLLKFLLPFTGSLMGKYSSTLL